MIYFNAISDFMDLIWEEISVVFPAIGGLLAILFYPLILMGPAVAIIGIVLSTILITRWLSVRTEPERLKKLRSDFQHWMSVRKAAMQASDNENQKKINAKAVDQSYLDEIYVKMYIESTCWNGLTKGVPILLMLHWVTCQFNTENLIAQYGKGYVVKLPFALGVSGDTLGAFGWFLTSLVLCYLGLWMFKMVKRGSIRKIFNICI